MPIIKDPRQNSSQEKQYGILYVAPNEATDDIPSGHYFYDKNRRNNDSRYFPHGYPVEIERIFNRDMSSLAEGYKDQYCDLDDEHFLYVSHLKNTEEYENYPMATFMYNLIQNGDEQQGRGLRKIPFGARYRFVRFDDIGGLVSE